MAQWQGQYSGRNHESKVKDIENSLRKAVESLKVASDAEKNNKTKAVRKLSKRLLSARLNMLKSRISFITESQPEDSIERTKNLRKKVHEIDEIGIEGVLREFDATVN